MILGLDVSSRNIGWALLDRKPPYYINSGVFITSTNKDHVDDGLMWIAQNNIRGLLKEFSDIECCVLENVVFKSGRNVGSVSTIAMLSNYRGIAISALQEFDIPVILQYPATTKSRLKVKKIHEKPKVDVHLKVKKIIPLLENTHNEDELDAVALALAYMVNPQSLIWETK